MIGRVRGRVGPAAPAGAALVLACFTAAWAAGALVPLLLVAGFCAGRAPSRVLGAAGLAALLTLAAGTGADADVVPMLMAPATAYATGLALRERAQVAARLTAQAAELEAERDAYAQLSVRYERARIAAELHDVVAHAISVMVVQAGAGQRLATAGPGAADATFAVIGEAARVAERDLDRLAGLLAVDADDDAADLALVRQLVDRAAASGLPVELALRGEAADVHGATAHAACRVVQEGLTNALRYAPGARVRVEVSARPARIDVRVDNDAPRGRPGLGLGSGRGLTGLRERVAACGGTLEARPDDDGGWSLRASIPRVPSPMAGTLP